MSHEEEPWLDERDALRERSILNQRRLQTLLEQQSFSESELVEIPLDDVPVTSSLEHHQDQFRQEQRNATFFVDYSLGMETCEYVPDSRCEYRVCQETGTVASQEEHGCMQDKPHDAECLSHFENIEASRQGQHHDSRGPVQQECSPFFDSPFLCIGEYSLHQVGSSNILSQVQVMLWRIVLCLFSFGSLIVSMLENTRSVDGVLIRLASSNAFVTSLVMLALSIHYCKKKASTESVLNYNMSYG